jgi:hypothetical protein
VGLALAGFNPRNAQALGMTADEQLEEVFSSEQEIALPTPTYDAASFVANWGFSPDTFIECDPNGDVLSSIKPANKATFHKFQTGACREQALIDSLAAKEEQKRLAEAEAQTPNALVGSCGYTGVGGEGNILKVAPVTSESRIVYIMCGKKVAVYEPPSCSCSQSTFRYSYSCKRPPTIYITLPCPGKSN